MRGPFWLATLLAFTAIFFQLGHATAQTGERTSTDAYRLANQSVAGVEIPTARTEACTQPTPTMFGDIIAILIGLRSPAAAPVSYGGLKIAENESPLPMNRVFATYNYYNNVNSVVDVHREVIGFEQTFLDGRASVGMRLPFFQADGPGPDRYNKIDDLSVTLKYAIWLDRPTGSAVSVGLSVTAPTGAVYRDTNLNEHRLVQFQQFAAAIWQRDRFYVHGFSSVVLPTDDVAPTLFFNDVGVGYWAYQNPGGRLLTGVVPTIEAHVTTPLNHRGEQDPERRRDLVNVTAGTHLFFGNRSLGFAVGTPVTGPRLFTVEGIVQFNWRY